jgi:hypothetical protein
MVERRVEGDFDCARAEGTPPATSAERRFPIASESPTAMDETPHEEAAWTERMLNSLVASGRRERGLQRRPHSDARSYAAYDAVAQPAAPTAKGTVDRGTVEVAPGEAAPCEQEDERARRVATTVTLRPRRSSWSWIAVAAVACGMACAAAMAWPAKRATDVPPPRPLAAATAPESPTVHASGASEPAVPARPATTGTVEARPAVAPVTRIAEPPNRPPLTATPTPSGSDAHGAHRPFVDVVNRY